MRPCETLRASRPQTHCRRQHTCCTTARQLPKRANITSGAVKKTKNAHAVAFAQTRAQPWRSQSCESAALKQAPDFPAHGRCCLTPSRVQARTLGAAGCLWRPKGRIWLATGPQHYKQGRWHRMTLDKAQHQGTDESTRPPHLGCHKRPRLWWVACACAQAVGDCCQRPSLIKFRQGTGQATAGTAGRKAPQPGNSHHRSCSSS